MLLARVEGNVTATRKHPSFAGWRLIICQPIGREGQPEGAPCVALDSLGAGMHERVLLSSDGLAARKAVGDDKSPARWIIIGIVDEVTPGTNALEDAAGGSVRARGNAVRPGDTGSEAGAPGRKRSISSTR